MHLQNRSFGGEKIWLVLSIVVSLAVLLAGCDKATPTPETQPPTPTTLAPTTAPTMTLPASTPETLPTQTTLIPTQQQPGTPTLNPAVQISVRAGEVMPVVASSEGATSYEWQVQDADGTRTLPETGNVIRYTAPNRADVVVLTVVARNNQAASPPTALTIKVEPPIQTASVALSALGIPAGWMSSGAAPGEFIRLQGGSQAVCHTGADCYHFTYQPGGSWGGVLWWPLACGESGTAQAWDAVGRGACGINVLETGRLANVNQMTFWARGDTGNEAVEFKIGGPDLNPIPGRSIGKVSLTKEWKQYTIDLAGMDLTNAVGLFLWTAADADNSTGADFYLDDLQFEGELAGQ